MCLKIDMKWITRRPRHLDGVRDCIGVKHYGPRTEQGYLDWIKRFIHFHGKRHPPEVEAYLWHRGRMSDWSLVATRTNLCPQWSAMRYVRSWPIAPIDERRPNGRCRDVAVVGSAKLNGRKGSGTAARPLAMSGGSTIYTGPSGPHVCCASPIGSSGPDGGRI